MTFEEAKVILRAFERERVEYVLVGSMAMAAQGIVRATRDMGFFVSPRADNVERLKAALKSLYQDPGIDEITSEDLSGDYPVIQYTPPHGQYWLDIMAQLGDAFRYEDLEREEMTVDDIRICVASPRMLYRMKKDTVRPLDRADAARIRKVFGIEED